jgi:predicted CXXCH cytochrome family protein
VRARLLLGSAALLWGICALAASTPAGAQNPYEEVADTPHNFLGATTMREICLACHVAPPTPAGAGDQPIGAAPVWGGAGQGGAFFPVANDPAGGAAAPDTSGRCLECHDGVLATAVHDHEGPVRPERGGTRHPDHPIRVLYPRDPGGAFLVPTPIPQNRQYWSVPDIRAGKLTVPTGPISTYQPITGTDMVALTFGLVRVRDGEVHCESCHNPHSNQFPPFLRQMPPGLCLVCHDK